MKDFIISCDWGTSKFRLCLVNTADHTIEKELITKDGIHSVFNSWKENSTSGKITVKDFFLGLLLSHLDTLLKDSSDDLTSLPVIISGMATSKQGLHELPYAKLPFSLDGTDAVVHQVAPNTKFPFELTLISGVMSLDDVMRGEETQMVGIANMVDFSKATDEAWCIFPGTHSKHICIQKGKIVSFKTYITGELFQLLTTYSLLQTAVSFQDNTAILDEKNLQAFYSGVTQSATGLNLLNKLFTVRTNDLMGILTKPENFFYLSGLLIGYETRVLQQEKNCPVFLCSGNNMFQLYRLAMEKLNLGVPVIHIAPDLMDKAAIAGQIKIFNQQRLTT